MWRKGAVAAAGLADDGSEAAACTSVWQPAGCEPGGLAAGVLRPTCQPSHPLHAQNLAVFTVESKWKPNKPLEAKNCYGTTSIEHPAVQVGPLHCMCTGGALLAHGAVLVCAGLLVPSAEQCAAGCRTCGVHCRPIGSLHASSA